MTRGEMKDLPLARYSQVKNLPNILYSVPWSNHHLMQTCWVKLLGNLGGL